MILSIPLPALSAFAGVEFVTGVIHAQAELNEPPLERRCLECGTPADDVDCAECGAPVPDVVIQWDGMDELLFAARLIPRGYG